ncbi:hypothetical protein B0J11DRAFT_275748 [Dendryphion nanum]|uniref:Pentatricopeptide repeat-containing protein-mitochondrial domain-containing protein n=1 Tax=Dendryphion nanum TaxID=256645 RepID=A0A9P9E0R5_9PLEO|nr:hypothetical protein B0J11DRAFT_275748 [Dendryphion nanum]
MPPSTFVNDALWKCLCPPSRSTTASGYLSRVHSPLSTRNCLQTPRSQYRLNTTSSAVSKLFSEHKSDNTTFARLNKKPSYFRLKYDAPQEADEKPSLVHFTNAQLYETLRDDASIGNYNQVIRKTKILIKDRGERPNIRMYAAILKSFTSCEEGTAGKIRKVLDEMKEMGVELDIGACHDVLEALAVHPDYLLREEILQYMKDRWFSLTDRGHNMVVAGMLRDRLFEQAIGKIEEMLKQRIVVANWLWDKAVWLLLDYQEIEEAWHLLQLRKGTPNPKEPSKALWGHFLDIAGKYFHLESVNSIWTNQVIPDYVKPTTTTCLNVLNLAGRTGDVKLATDVFRVLSLRNTVFTSYHYEMLLETYLNAEDLSAALYVISIMAEAGIDVDEATIHPLYIYLRETPSTPIRAFEILQTFESSGRKVPTAAINVCIQASVHLEDLTQAIEFYKALHTVCAAGPNVHTFNILFQGCHKAGRKELAMFLATEMLELKIAPDPLTYDRLVLVCCHSGDLTDALLYYEEMRSQGYVPRRGCFEHLINKGVELGEEKTQAVLEDMKKCGYVPYRDTERAVTEMVIKTTTTDTTRNVAEIATSNSNELAGSPKDSTQA